MTGQFFQVSPITQTTEWKRKEVTLKDGNDNKVKLELWNTKVENIPDSEMNKILKVENVEVHVYKDYILNSHQLLKLCLVTLIISHLAPYEAQTNIAQGALLSDGCRFL